MPVVVHLPCHKVLRIEYAYGGMSSCAQPELRLLLKFLLPQIAARGEFYSRDAGVTTTATATATAEWK